MALTVEPSKPRFIFDAHPLNEQVVRKKIPFSMDAPCRVTPCRVAKVASKGYYMTSLDDASAFHHILRRPSP